MDKLKYFFSILLLLSIPISGLAVTASENTVLLGNFKPDLERMLEQYPVLGAKFLRETALIMANRMGQLTREIIILKKKVKELEQRV